MGVIRKRSQNRQKIAMIKTNMNNFCSSLKIKKNNTLLLSSKLDKTLIYIINESGIKFSFIDRSMEIPFDTNARYLTKY